MHQQDEDSFEEQSDMLETTYENRKNSGVYKKININTQSHPINENLH